MRRVVHLFCILMGRLCPRTEPMVKAPASHNTRDCRHSQPQKTLYAQTAGPKSPSSQVCHEFSCKHGGAEQQVAIVLQSKHKKHKISWKLPYIQRPIASTPPFSLVTRLALFRDPPIPAATAAPPTIVLGLYSHFYKQDVFNGIYAEVYHNLHASPDPAIADNIVPSPIDVTHLASQGLNVHLVIMMLAQDSHTKMFHHLYTFAPCIDQFMDYDNQN